MMKSDNTVSEKCKKKKKKKNLHIVAARYAIYSPAIQMYPSYIKLAVNISAMFTFIKSIYRWLLLSSAFDWAICYSGLIISNSTHKQRLFFFLMPTFFPLGDTVRRGFTVEQTLLIYPGYFSPVQYQGVASRSLLLKRCCPTPGSQSYFVINHTLQGCPLCAFGH